MNRKIRFDHEKLNVCQHSIEFVSWSTDILEGIPVKVSATAQLDPASTSIPLNIAEGNGRFTAADRCRFFDIARGSALECAAALDVLVAKRLLTEEQIETGKAELAEITSMLVGWIPSSSEARLYEDAFPDRVGTAEIRKD